MDWDALEVEILDLMLQFEMCTITREQFYAQRAEVFERYAVEEFA